MAPKGVVIATRGKQSQPAVFSSACVSPVFVTYEQAFVTHEQAFVTYEQAFVTYEQAFVTHEQAFVTHEQAFVTYEQAFVTHEQAFVTRDTPSPTGDAARWLRLRFALTESPKAMLPRGAAQSANDKKNDATLRFAPWGKPYACGTALAYRVPQFPILLG